MSNACHHPGEGRGLACRFAATFINALRAGQTPAFAGVVSLMGRNAICT
jgi:hypothetical protein